MQQKNTGFNATANAIAIIIIIFIAIFIAIVIAIAMTYQQGPCLGRGYKEDSPCELKNMFELVNFLLRRLSNFFTGFQWNCSGDRGLPIPIPLC